MNKLYDKKIEYQQYGLELENKVPDYKSDHNRCVWGHDKLNSGGMNMNLINLIVWVSSDSSIVLRKYKDELSNN